MHTAFVIIACIAIALQALILGVALFGPGLRYQINSSPEAPLDSEYFQNLLTALTQSDLQGGNTVEVLKNGDCFYEAELREIARAGRSINLEAYIFHKGAIARRYVQALAERARAGVQVRVTLDYIGSLSTPLSYFKELRQAGGRVAWYHSLRLDLIPQINNRTHRELLVVDGLTAFIGGAGIADQWYTGKGRNPRWRDTVLRVQGPVVAGLQSVFAQNWLRVAGEILTGADCFQFPKTRSSQERITGEPLGLVVSSTPAAGSTAARILFQTLIASAKKQILISTPYFLPDHSARSAIIKAVKERGVLVKILTPGRRSDQVMTRASSRELYGTLLKHGVEIHEYEPAMIHVKAMMVDGCWAVVGSTNFDYRSFDLNDEVNLALLDPAITQRLEQDFERDLEHSRRIDYDQWCQRMRFRIADRLMSILERQE